VCRQIRIEDLDLFDPYIRVTRRLAFYIYQLCQVMTVSEVANHLNLNWKTVKAVDKQFLEHQYGKPDLNNLRILAVDEIAVRRGHQYLTVVLDYLSGRVLFVGKDRKAETLIDFFEQMSSVQRESIEAVAMDMWDPFVKAVKKKFRGRKSCSTSFMLLLPSAGSSTKYEILSTGRHPRKTKQSSKAHGICC
jgi:transposase